MTYGSLRTLPAGARAAPSRRARMCGWGSRGARRNGHVMTLALGRGTRSDPLCVHASPGIPGCTPRDYTRARRHHDGPASGAERCITSPVLLSLAACALAAAPPAVASLRAASAASRSLNAAVLSSMQRYKSPASRSRSVVTVTRWRCTAATATSPALSCSPDLSQAHQEGEDDASAEDGPPGGGFACLPRSLSWLRSRSRVATRAARVSRSACSDASSERRRSC